MAPVVCFRRSTTSSITALQALHCAGRLRRLPEFAGTQRIWTDIRQSGDVIGCIVPFSALMLRRTFSQLFGVDAESGEVEAPSKFFLLVGLVMAVACVVYWPALQGSLLWDDAA